MKASAKPSDAEEREGQDQGDGHRQGRRRARPRPSGKVTLLLGKKKVGTGTLKNGKVTITVKGSSLKKGKNKLVVAYAPKGGFAAPKKAPSVTITRKK